MKFLNIIRHAKAEQVLAEKKDFLRCLSKRGINDIKNLDNYLLQFNFKKHKIICSTSI